MKLILVFFLSLVFICACDSSEHLSNIEQMKRLRGMSACDELNEIVQDTLTYHYSKTSDDLPDIYDATIRELLFDVTKIYTKAPLKTLKQKILPNGRADVAGLKECRDLRTVVNFLERQTVNAAQRDQWEIPIYQYFLDRFGKKFDSMTGFAGNSGSSQNHGFGFLADMSLLNSYGVTDEEGIRVMAISGDDPEINDDATRIKVNDRILKVLPPYKNKFFDVSEFFDSLDEIAFLNSIFHSSYERKLRVVVDRQSPDKTHIFRKSLELRENTAFQPSGEEPLVEARRIGKHVIYARLADFREGVSRQLANRIISLKNISDEKTGVILDLRFNSGGLLSESARVLDLFLNAGAVIKILTRDEELTISLTDPGVTIADPLIVLTNHLSASASEMTAQVLYDTKRARVFSEGPNHQASFGKGSGQRIRKAETLGIVFRITSFLFSSLAGTSPQRGSIDTDLMVEDPRMSKLRKSCRLTWGENCPPQKMKDLERYGGKHIELSRSFTPIEDVTPVRYRNSHGEILSLETQIEVDLAEIYAREEIDKQSDDPFRDVLLETAVRIMNDHLQPVDALPEFMLPEKEASTSFIH